MSSPNPAVCKSALTYVLQPIDRMGTQLPHQVLSLAVGVWLPYQLPLCQNYLPLLTYCVSSVPPTACCRNAHCCDAFCRYARCRSGSGPRLFPVTSAVGWSVVHHVRRQSQCLFVRWAVLAAPLYHCPCLWAAACFTGQLMSASATESPTRGNSRRVTSSTVRDLALSQLPLDLDLLVSVFYSSYYFLSLVDISAYHRGFHGDLNETLFVGAVDEHSRRLVQAAYDCLDKAIDIGTDNYYHSIDIQPVW